MKKMHPPEENVKEEMKKKETLEGRKASWGPWKYLGRGSSFKES